MSSAAISALGAAAGAIAMIFVFLLSKRHKEDIEDRTAESSTVTAISSASETLAAAVNVLIEPLNQSIIRLQEQERSTSIEMTKIKAELAMVKADHRRLNRDLDALIKYVRQLWAQIQQTGTEPVPPPPDLAHVVWDDVEGYQ